MKLFKTILISVSFVMSGCSPFGNSSFIEQISDGIVDLFATKTTSDINSGGSQNLISAPVSGQPTDVHQMSASIGNVYQQSTFVTSQGNTVEIMISGTRQ